MKRIIFLMAGCLFMVVCGEQASAFQQKKDPNQVQQVSKEKIKQLIGLFATEDKEAHLKAARELIAIGEQAYPALYEAMRSRYDDRWQHAVDAFLEIGGEGVPAMLAVITLESTGELRHNGGAAVLSELGEAVLPQLEEGLNDEEQMIRLAAIWVIGRQTLTMGIDFMSGKGKRYGGEALAEVLVNHDDWMTRMAAAEGLGMMYYNMLPPEAVVEALNGAKEDENEEVQNQASIAISNSRMPSQDEGLSCLIQSLKSENWNTRFGAIMSLQQMGPRAAPAIPALVEVMEDEENMQGEDAARILVGLLPESRDELLKSITSSRIEVRMRVAKVLPAYMKPEVISVIPDLTAALKAEDEKVRANAARAIGYLGISGEIAIPALIEALGDEDNTVCSCAATALESFGAEAIDALEDLIKVVQNEDREKDRYGFIANAAIKAIGGMGPAAREAIPVLEGHLEKEEIAAAAAGAALGRIGPEAIPTLRAALKHSNRDIRYNAVRALLYLGPEAAEAVPDLIETIDDEGQYIPSSSIQALGAIGPAAREAGPRLLEALKSDYSFAAAEALGKIGIKEAVPELMKMLEDEKTEGRIEIASALVRLGEPEAAIPVLIDYVDQDWSFGSFDPLQMLTDIGPEARAAVEVITKKLNDPEKENYEKVEYAKALMVIDPESGVGEAFLRDRIGEFGEFSAMAALVETGHVDEEIVGVLKGYMSGDHEYSAIEGAGILVQIESEREAAVEFLLVKLGVEDFEHRFSAAVSLGRVGVCNEESIEVLTMVATSKDELNRYTYQSKEAIEVLGMLGPAAEGARGELDKLLYDEDEEVRWDALEVIKLIVGGRREEF